MTDVQFFITGGGCVLRREDGSLEVSQGLSQVQFPTEDCARFTTWLLVAGRQVRAAPQVIETLGRAWSLAADIALGAHTDTVSRRRSADAELERAINRQVLNVLRTACQQARQAWEREQRVLLRVQGMEEELQEVWPEDQYLTAQDVTFYRLLHRADTYEWAIQELWTITGMWEQLAKGLQAEEALAPVERQLGMSRALSHACLEQRCRLASLTVEMMQRHLVCIGEQEDLMSAGARPEEGEGHE